MLETIFRPLTSRYEWARLALDVQNRFSEIRGGYLASAVTLNLFLAIFPLLLVTVAVVGFLTSGGTEVAKEIISQFGLTGQAAEGVEKVLDDASRNRKTASIVGVVGLLFSGLGVASAIEYALDRTWQQTGRGIKDRLRGLLWATGALAIFGCSLALSAVLEWVADGLVSTVLVWVAVFAVNVLFWMWTFVVLSFRRVDLRAYLPGALLAALGLEMVKQITTLVPSLVTGSSAIYGTLGPAFVVFASLLLFGRVVVYASVLNVVKWEGNNGTVTLDIEAPNVPGIDPVEANRGGAAEEPDTDNKPADQ